MSVSTVLVAPGPLKGKVMIRRFSMRANNGDFICAEEGGGREVVANRGIADNWEHFYEVPVGDNKIALQTYRGNYLCAEGGGGGSLVANRRALAGWETFRPHLQSGKVAFQTPSGHFWCAEGGGGREVVADRTEIGGWGLFDVHETMAAKIALMAFNGQYVCVENGAGREIHANRNAIGGWETFYIEKHGNHFAFRSSGGKYLCAEEGGGGALVADRDAVGGWEQFSIKHVGFGRIALRSANGHYVCAEGGGGSEVNATRGQRAVWETFRVAILQDNPRFVLGGRSIHRTVNLTDEPVWIKPEHESSTAVRVDKETPYEGPIDGIKVRGKVIKVLDNCDDVVVWENKVEITCGNLDRGSVGKKIGIDIGSGGIEGTAQLNQAAQTVFGGVQSEWPDEGWKPLWNAGIDQDPAFEDARRTYNDDERRPRPDSAERAEFERMDRNQYETWDRDMRSRTA